MGFSEIPPPPEVTPGNDVPVIRTRPPGPQSRTWLLRNASAPMGPKPVPDPSRGIIADVPSGTIVYASGKGANVIDVDGNRFVDLAAGFGSLLLGHAHPHVVRVIEMQAPRLLQALGDVYPSEPKIALTQRLARLYPAANARVILGQSGADAVSAALKTAVLFTERPGVIAFSGAYHGLGYGPLAACGLRPSYRQPFASQLNPDVRFIDYPDTQEAADEAVERVRFELASESVGAILFEPILGRGGVVIPPPDLIGKLAALAHEHGALLIADEIWTGLGRSGKMLFSSAAGVVPDLICLGKGLGGGLPISACIGSAEVMAAWSQEREVVHTSTFAGAPLACATAICTLGLLGQHDLVARAQRVGDEWRAGLAQAVQGTPHPVEVRGAGLMVGIDLGGWKGGAISLMRWLLERGYIVSTGGGQREVLVLTPPLTISEDLLNGFVAQLRLALQACAP